MMTHDTSTPYTYDAIIVLGNNIRRAENGYLPTTYDDHDQYGMLGGEMNVLAAVAMHEKRATSTFLFSTGTSEKTKAAFGPNVPTEAEVYSAEFVKRIDRADAPHILLEKRSVNTYSNITECLDIIKEQGWKRVAIQTLRYHTPRVRALAELARKNHPVDAEITFLAAEDILEQELPGKYDERIAQAYASEEGQKRLRNEQQGLDDLKSGKYVVTEFQLKQ